MQQLRGILILLLALPHLSDGSPAINCTYTNYVFGIVLPDYTYCMFTQTVFGDDFNWQIGDSATTTPDTGPDVDNTGDRGGHFAYIDSSSRANGSHAQLSSPTFMKSASEAGGCVQFYYHMYGADIGRLSVVVYDNTQSGGVVTSFEIIGNQGNQWLRADMDLNLPAGQEVQMQMVINAYTAGNSSKDNKGDIAIDDILVYTNGPCTNASETPPSTPPTTTALSTPSVTTAQQSWSCQFNTGNSYCGITRFRYGASFTLASRSFRGTTGPQSDHTQGGGVGYFLYMLGSGVLANSSAVAETPQFDQTYYCFNFWYHMFGSGVGQLMVSADVDGLSQELWSQTGDQGNQWRAGSVPLPPGSIKIIITAVRGSNADSDIALDDLSLSTTNCQGATVPSTSTTPPTTPPTTRAQPSFTLACNFDDDDCNMYQERTNDFDWSRHSGPTYNLLTGPDNDHTLGTFEGHYMYIPSNYKQNGKRARIQTGMVNVVPGEKACLRFAYHMNGADMGTLSAILVSPSSRNPIFTKSGTQGTDWIVASIDITFSESPVYLEFEGTIQHSYTGIHQVKSDMAIDDVILTNGNTQCSDLDLERVSSPVTVATTTLQTTEHSTVSTATPTTTPTPPTTKPWTTPTTTPSLIQTCDFDNSAICGFTQASNDQFDWSRTSSKIWSSDTGPSFDHTTGNGTGFFMYIRAAYKNNGSVARLSSPVYDRPSSGGACLTFWYHMWGSDSDMGSLRVILHKGFRNSLVFSKSGNQGNQWRFQAVDLDIFSATDFQIQFEGVVIHNHDDGHLNIVLGDIAIDDVVVDRSGPCSGLSTPSTSSPPPPLPLPSPPSTPATSSTPGTGGSSSTPSKDVTTLSPAQAERCNFDSSAICGFTQASNDQFDWSRTSRKSWGSNTGPSFDHTTGNGTGSFMYIRAAYKNNGSVARLSSPVYDRPSSGGACLTFWYHMWGSDSDMGSLRVILHKGFRNSLVFSKSGNQGNQWLFQAVDLDIFSATDFQIQFEGVVIHNHDDGHLKIVLGDIAIDDVTIYQSMTCSGLPATPSTAATQTVTTPTLPTSSKAPTTTRPPTTTVSTKSQPKTSKATPSTTPPPTQIKKCNFDDTTLCGFIQETNDQFDWSRTSRKIWSSETGPTFDHTTGNGTGSFMYIRAAYKNNGSVARLSSPVYDRPSSGGACLTFWYHMWGSDSDMGSLRVILHKGLKTSLLFSERGNQGNKWLSQSIDLKVAVDFQIQFEGVVIHNHTDGHLNIVLGDIAIDDVVIDLSGSCFGSPSSSGQSAGPTAKGMSRGVVAATVVSILIVLILVAVGLAVIYMRRRQLWIFAPGTKMSVIFSRTSSEETGYIYDKFNNDGADETSVQPTLVINGFGQDNKSNGVFNPTYSLDTSA